MLQQLPRDRLPEALASGHPELTRRGAAGSTGVVFWTDSGNKSDPPRKSLYLPRPARVVMSPALKRSVGRK